MNENVYSERKDRKKFQKDIAEMNERKLAAQTLFENLFEKHLINVCKFEKDENQLLFTSFNLKKINYIFDQATNDYSTCLDYKKSIETFCEKNDLSLSIEYVNWEEVVIHLSFK